MKLNREQIIELFGSAPADQNGKKLVGVELRRPNAGEVFLSQISKCWEIADCVIVNPRQVAIFETTNRESDGTPMGIDPLPVVEGYRVEYAGFRYFLEIEVDLHYIYSETLGKWCSMTSGDNYEGVGHHIALAYKVAKPTTLADLVGEDGQKNLWVISEDGDATACQVNKEDDVIKLKLSFADEYNTIEGLSDSRWSNSPFTHYLFANEFVGGDNE